MCRSCVYYNRQASLAKTIERTSHLYRTHFITSPVANKDPAALYKVLLGYTQGRYYLDKSTHLNQITINLRRSVFDI